MLLGAAGDTAASTVTPSIGLQINYASAWPLVIFLGFLLCAAVLAAVWVWYAADSKWMRWLHEWLSSTDEFEDWDTYRRPLIVDPKTAWGRPEADVSVLRFALDARVRKHVATELERATRGIDPSTDEGRFAQLRAVALTLRRLRDTWRYAGAVNLPMTTIQDARRQFSHHVADARGRFTGSEPPPPDGDPGLVVVTIVLAARTELFSVRSIGTGEDLRQALESASNHAARDLFAIEILWMPADESAALSSETVRAKYPQPDLVELPGAMSGKAVCEACAGPYPAELLACPHCGAHRSAA